jgi:hydroxymethylpyrimidine pyrophosphatase-like HAD family hydrolase
VFNEVQFAALATDYDGTLAEDGHVSATTLEGLHRLKASGRKLVMVTGRELPDLKHVFPDLGVFDLVVVENGALLYWPSTDEERPLAPSPPKEFIERLMELKVAPISIGRCIVATWEPHETAVLQAIKDMQLELSITFNKGAVMVLPTGVNKATGLDAALEQLGLTRDVVIGVGDAENDQAFLKICGMSVAVANALDSVKKTARWVTERPRGDGVVNLIDALLAADNK